MRRLLAAALALATPAAAQEMPPDQAALKAHVQFLASDALHGRKVGTNDFDIAAEYAAAQMLTTGLQPAGSGGGWFQSVDLVSFGVQAAGTAAITLESGRLDLKPETEGLVLGHPSGADAHTIGRVVFAGHGLVYPAGGIDDYAGIDVRGKIVALLADLPDGLPSDLQAHFSNGEVRGRLAAAHGAIGVVLLQIVPEDSPFHLYHILVRNYRSVHWAEPGGLGLAQPAPALAILSTGAAEKLFANSRLRWSEVVAADRAGKPVPRGLLAATLETQVRTRVIRRSSRNVIGLLPGGDPVLRDEYVVVSAHLDHVGIIKNGKRDDIYNGALDNALGVATILEVARAFQASGQRPRRSILFVALTAEEEGLLGSGYFAHFPGVSGRIVANINLDMPILTYPLEDLVVLGAERSTLGPFYDHAAATEGLKVVPDPSPEEMFFTRSDHYSFVQAGIPSVSVDAGPGGGGAAAQREFLDKHYHQPSDDPSQPIDWESAAKYARVNYAAARAIADADARPSWHKGDFFGVTFGGYGAR